MPRNNPPNTLPNVLDDLDSDPTSSDSSYLNSSDSSDNDYFKPGQRKKTIKRNSRVKCVSMNLSKSAQILQPRYLQLCTNQWS